MYFIQHEIKGNLRQVIGFMNKKMNLGSLGMSLYVSNGLPPIMLGFVKKKFISKWNIFCILCMIQPCKFTKTSWFQ